LPGIVHIELDNYSILKRQFTLAKNFVIKNYADASHELWIFRGLTQLVKRVLSGNKKETRLATAVFLKSLQSKKIPDKEYLEDWLADRL
jgi:hypothetical protein